ncbi:MAG: hypothetical protein QNK59_02010 [Flavobacteriales bacterium]
MKNWIKFGAVALVLQVAFSAQAQTEDPIEYFTDSKISDTKFSLAAVYAPAYASRRLALYEPVADGNELFAMLNEGAGGVYGQRYGMMAYYELRGMFHVGIGFTTQKSGFISKDFAVFDQNAIFQDTIGVFNAKTSYSALNIPIQFIFHTQITDLWALQVIPSYDLTFYNMIDRSWVGEGVPDYSTDAATGVLGTMYDRGSEESIQYHKGFNGCIGFALGNEFTVSNNLVLSLRAEFRLGLLPINSSDVALSEVPYGVGGSVGFRYYL